MEKRNAIVWPTIAAFAAAALSCGGPPRDIHQAARRGDGAAVKEFLAKDAAAATSLDGEKSTPLHKAATKEIVGLLLAAGADVNAPGDMGRTPLHTAASPEVAAALISHGANLEAPANHPDGGTMTPLETAVKKGSVEIAAVLIQAGAKPVVFRLPILYYAAQQGRTSLVKALLEGGMSPGADPNAIGAPLHWAVFNGQEAAAELLLKAGADPNERLPKGVGVRVDIIHISGHAKDQIEEKSPLQLAKSESMKQLLRRHGASE